MEQGIRNQGLNGPAGGQAGRAVFLADKGANGGHHNEDRQDQHKGSGL
jgi:hypothetical protein